MADQYKIGPYAGPPRDGARPSGAEGGHEAEGRFASPAANTGREGGRLCAAPLFCSLFMSPPGVSLECDFSAHGAKKDPRRGLTMASIFRLFPHRGPIHTRRRPAPCRPLPWHGGGVIPPAWCLWVCHSTLTHGPHCDISSIGRLDSLDCLTLPRPGGSHDEFAVPPCCRIGHSGIRPACICPAGPHCLYLRAFSSCTAPFCRSFGGIVGASHEGKGGSAALYYPCPV